MADSTPGVTHAIMSFTSTPSEQTDEDGVRFGRTLIQTVAGELPEQAVDGIACPANRRGVMGAGAAGAVRLAGGMEVEREAMAAAPLTIGTAVATTAGDLSAHGVRVILHAVVSDMLGAPTREDIIKQATADVLRLADRQRVRALALPPLGAGLGPGRVPTSRVWELMIEETVAYLRRFTSRLERIVLVTRFPDEAEELTRMLRIAREHWWGLRG